MLCISSLTIKRNIGKPDPKKGYKTCWQVATCTTLVVQAANLKVGLFALIAPTGALARVETCSQALLAAQVQQAKHNPGALSGQLAQACPSCAQGPAMWLLLHRPPRTLHCTPEAP